MWFRWFPNAYSTKFDADRPRFRPADFRSFRWLFRCFSTNGDSCFPHCDPCDFVDFLLVLQRNPSQAAQFPEFSIFADITNAFSTKWDASGASPRFCIFDMFSYRNWQKSVCSGPTPGIFHFDDITNAFSSKFRLHRFQTSPNGNRFFGGDNPAAWLCWFRWFPNGFSTKWVKIRSPDLPPPDLAISLIFLMVFHRIDAFIFTAWAMQFRWFSIGFSTKSAPVDLFVRFSHFVDLPTVFIEIIHFWDMCGFVHFVDLLTVFQRNSMPVVEIWTCYFVDFPLVFNEMRPRGSISRLCNFVDFPLVFQRNAIPGGSYPDLADSHMSATGLRRTRSRLDIPLTMQGILRFLVDFRVPPVPTCGRAG